MFQIVYKYLILNRQVTIPGIGTFQVVQLPARLDFVKKVICSPAPTIKFTPATANSDQNFYAFAADQLKVNPGTAVNEVDDFALLLKTAVSRQEVVELPNMGTLHTDEDGKVSFLALDILQEYYPDIAAERVVSTHSENAVITADKESANIPTKDTVINGQTRTHKDNWWIAATLLAIIGIAAILYYYLVMDTL